MSDIRRIIGATIAFASHTSTPPRCRAKVIKIESFQEGKVLQVNKGDILTGYFFYWPVVGKSFIIYTCLSENIYKSPIPVTPIYTTEVKEIIDDRTFKTKNSIYKIVTLEDERDEKIKIILK